jgi:hypothetical protein
MTKLKRMKTANGIAESGDGYSCSECEWTGSKTEVDVDSFYNDFTGHEIKHPICPECGGSLNY